MGTEDEIFNCASSRISIRFTSPIFLPDFPSFVEQLEKKGFTQLGRLDFPTPPNAFNVSYEISDQIATKDDIIVDLDTSKQYLGVQLMKSDEVHNIFTEIRDLFLKNNPELEKRIWFYEFQAGYRYHSKSTAIEKIAKTAQNLTLLDEASKLTGKRLSLRGVTMSSYNQEPNNESYTDLSIIPDLNNSKLYNIVTIFRDKAEGSVISFSKHAHEKIRKLLENIDSS